MNQQEQPAALNACKEHTAIDDRLQGNIRPRRDRTYLSRTCAGAGWNAMLMLNSVAPSWESLRASTLLSLDDVRAALDLDAIASLLRTPVPNDTAQLARWLEDEGLAVADGRGYYVTNLGAIAAARKLSEFEALKRKAVRVVRYRGINKVETVHERSGRRGYAVGFHGLVDYLRRVLPHSEVIDSALRRNVSEFPDLAVRELVANALIHQDCGITGTRPMIGIFDDRIEVTNPGSLLPSKRPDRLIGTTPESRNEKLAWSGHEDSPARCGRQARGSHSGRHQRSEGRSAGRRGRRDVCRARLHTQECEVSRPFPSPRQWAGAARATWRRNLRKR